MTSLTITRPDDWHIHLRDDDALKRTVADVSRYFGRAIVMPNLAQPIVNTKQAEAYQQRINAAVPTDASFTPLMTLYLTNNTTASIIEDAKRSGFVYAAKLYPAGATTNSDSGVTDLAHIYPALEAMEKCGMPLLIHGEVVSSDIDIFDREKVFIDEKLIPLMARFPQLPIVFEHITTRDAAQFVEDGPSNLAATITAHHLLFNRNHLLTGGIHPHLYCLPVLKRNIHQKALIDAATRGNTRFFLGTDSAPHSIAKKESDCGCAGIYTAHGAIELYAEVFEQEQALDKLEAFASFNGPDFYQLPRNTSTITLEKKSWEVPSKLSFADTHLIPLRSGELINWTVTQ